MLKTTLAFWTAILLGGAVAVPAQATDHYWSKHRPQLPVSAFNHPGNPTEFSAFNPRDAFAFAPDAGIGAPVWHGIVGDTVYRDGRMLGRDPDPNVRQLMARDYPGGF